MEGLSFLARFPPLIKSVGRNQATSCAKGIPEGRLIQNGFTAAIDELAANGDVAMTGKTCAACDCRLDENAIKVTIGTRVVEVCCDACAQRLREAAPGHEVMSGKELLGG